MVSWTRLPEVHFARAFFGRNFVSIYSIPKWNELWSRNNEAKNDNKQVHSLHTSAERRRFARILCGANHGTKHSRPMSAIHVTVGYDEGKRRWRFASSECMNWNCNELYHKRPWIAWWSQRKASGDSFLPFFFRRNLKLNLINELNVFNIFVACKL